MGDAKPLDDRRGTIDLPPITVDRPVDTKAAVVVADPEPDVDRRGTIESPALIFDEPPEEARRTVAAPALSLALAKRTAPDPVAAERGIRPITSPFVRSAPTRSWLYTVVPMLVAVAAVIWALSR